MAQRLNGQVMLVRYDERTSSVVSEPPWERRFVVAVERAPEFAQLYESLGFEVRLEPARPSDMPECQACPIAEDCEACVVLYTRRREIGR